MLNRVELLNYLENPTSLQEWLDTPPGDRDKKITSIRIELRLFKPIKSYIDNNNQKALIKLLKVLKSHLSIVNSKDDGYSKRQCLDAIIYALNMPSAHLPIK